MYKQYLRSYRDNSKAHLESIIKSQDVQHYDAVRAAAKILEEKYGEKHFVKAAPREKIRLNYFRTFSLREVFSIGSTLLIFLALLVMLINMNHFAVFADNSTWWVLVLVVFVILLNHRIYVMEHRRANDILGRVLHAIMFLTGVVLISFALHVVTNGVTAFFGALGGLTDIFGIYLIIIPLELGLSFLRIFFNILKWRIL